MKEILRHRSRRSGYDGWALRLPEWRVPLPWTVSTTREEVREVVTEIAPPGQDAGE